MPTTAPLPHPPRDSWPLVTAVLALLAGAGLLGLALAGHLGGDDGTARAAAPPAAPALVVTLPAPAATAPVAVAVAEAPAPTKVVHADDLSRFATNDRAHVPAAWVSGFYDIYAIAQKTYGVNWLLIASVHKQETAFSTHPTTYRGLNFARCCAGPMQFNVTNGIGGARAGSTWARYRSAASDATRPAVYPHRTERHPSVYDDFDAIMAAGKLLRDSGASRRLDASAWRAAYDYYGHDLTGVDYANEVLARAIGWGQGTFCINCGTDGGMLSAIDAAWGAPVRASMTPPPAADEPTALAGRRG